MLISCEAVPLIRLNTVNLKQEITVQDVIPFIKLSGVPLAVVD